MVIIAGSVEKWSKTKDNGIEEPPWRTTRNNLISSDTFHRRKPTPIKLDCDLDSKSHLGLMHLALKALNGELLLQFLIFPASSSQLLWKCPSPKLAAGTSAGHEKQRR